MRRDILLTDMGQIDWHYPGLLLKNHPSLSSINGASEKSCVCTIPCLFTTSDCSLL